MEEIIKPNSDNALEKKEPVKVKKKSGFRDFFDAVRPKNPDSFLHHVIYHILIPSALNATEDTLKDGIDHWLHPSDSRYGDRRYRYDDRDRRGGVSYISYNDMYESDRNSKPYEPSYRERTPNPREIVYTDRQTADMVLEEMRGIIYESGFCSIAEFYEILKKVTNGRINVSASYVDEVWGWSELRDIRPSSSYDGKYIIRFPKAEHM